MDLEDYMILVMALLLLLAVALPSFRLKRARDLLWVVSFWVGVYALCWRMLAIFGGLAPVLVLPLPRPPEAHRRSLGWHSPGPVPPGGGGCSASRNFREGQFCELRLLGVLGSPISGAVTDAGGCLLPFVTAPLLGRCAFATFLY